MKTLFEIQAVSFTRALLFCGILASLHYAAINVVVPLQWPQYSVLDQTVSELSAIGAPTRTLWLALVWPWGVLLAGLGWGILRSAGTNRPLRIVGWSILALCVLSLYWPPMHQRDVLAAGGGTLTDTLHLVWAGATVFLFIVIMGFGAAALGMAFRAYTIASLVLLAIFGVMTSMAAPDVEANLPTPWIGVWERINIGLFLLWIAVLAAILIRRQAVSDGLATAGR